MINLLAAVVEVTGPEGEHVVVDPMGPIWGSALFLALILTPVVIILLFFFYKKKLQHQQILAAMEKGLPVKDLLEPPKKKEKTWITNISAGIGLVFIAVCLVILYIPAGVYVTGDLGKNMLIVIPVVLFGIGITRLLRGLFQKAELKNKPAEDEEEEDIEMPPPVLPVE